MLASSKTINSYKQRHSLALIKSQQFNPYQAEFIFPSYQNFPLKFYTNTESDNAMIHLKISKRFNIHNGCHGQAYFREIWTEDEFRWWGLYYTWWRHQMETFSELLAICAGNSPVPTKGQWRGALMYSLICVWINGWVNNGEAGDLGRHRTHYDVIVMICQQLPVLYLPLYPIFCVGLYKYPNPSYNV